MIKVLASGSSGNCIVVANKIMLDCGIKITPHVRAKHKVCMSDIAFLLVTHEHLDHAGGVAGVMRFGIDVFASQGTIDALGIKQECPGFTHSHRVFTVQSKRLVEVADWQIMPFAAFHDAADPLGFMLSDGKAKILYATDTGQLPYDFPGLTHILLEINHDTELLAANMEPVVARRIAANHLSLDTAIEFLQRQDKSRLQEVHIIHMSNGNSCAERFKQAVQRATGAAVYVG